MLVTTLSVIVFGLLVIIALIIFACKKLDRANRETWKGACFFLKSEYRKTDDSQNSFKLLAEINADFLQRRNEFWNCLGQVTVIIVIITLITVLLLKGKITSDAAMPVIAGLGSFAVGKGIAGFNKLSASDGPKPNKDRREQ